MAFYWSLSDSKSPRVFRTLLSIPADLNEAEVWMVSILPLISNCSNHLSKPFGTVPRALTTTTSHLCSTFFFVLLQVLRIYLFIHVLIFSLCGKPELQNQLDDKLSLSLSLSLSLTFKKNFLFFSTRSGLLARIRNSFVCQNPGEFYSSHCLRQILICTYTI